MSRRLAALFLTGLTLFASPATAHETWLHVAVETAPKPAAPAAPRKGTKGRAAGAASPLPRLSVASGESGLVELATGARFPLPDSATAAERVDRTYLRIGAGRALPLTGARVDGNVLKLDATYAGVGLAALAVQLHPREITLEPEEFAAYLREIGATAALDERTAKKETKKPGREVYLKVPKTYVAVVSAAPRDAAIDVASAAEPLGLPLELTVAGDPTALTVGGTLEATLLADGRPLGAQTVRAFWEGGATEGLLTDDAGRVRLALARAGRLLLAATRVRRLAKADRRRGPAYKNADWESVWASLELRVFDRPAAPAGTPAPKKRRR